MSISRGGPSQGGPSQGGPDKGREREHVTHHEDDRPTGTRGGLFVRSFGLAGCLALLFIMAGYLAFWEGDAFKAEGRQEAAAPTRKGPDLGMQITAQQAAPWDISIGPDGVGLPAGRGKPEQGFKIYSEKCVSCHGKKGRGLSAEELAGGIGSLGEEWPEQTVGSYWPYATTLFDYIRRAMPPDAPLSLTSDQIYALSAYLLYLNGIIDSEAEMDARALRAVVMPNRDGFDQIWPGAARSPERSRD